MYDKIAMTLPVRARAPTDAASHPSLMVAGLRVWQEVPNHLVCTRSKTIFSSVVTFHPHIYTSRVTSRFLYILHLTKKDDRQLAGSSAIEKPSTDRPTATTTDIIDEA